MPTKKGDTNKPSAEPTVEGQTWKPTPSVPVPLPLQTGVPASPPLDAGAIAGIVIAIVVLALGGYWLFTRRAKQSASSAAKSLPQKDHDDAIRNPIAYEAGTYNPMIAGSNGSSELNPWPFVHRSVPQK